MVPNGYRICGPCVSPCSARNEWLLGNWGRRTELKSTYAPTLQIVQLRRCMQSELCPWNWWVAMNWHCQQWWKHESQVRNHWARWSLPLLCCVWRKKKWFRRKKVRMRSWMLRRENWQFSCLYYLGATNSLHYMDSRKAHICNIHWEPCILD